MTETETEHVGGVDLAPATSRTALTVPWWHVLPAALLLSLAGTFWVVGLRGTAAPALRADLDVEGWVRESAVLLPGYLVATLAVVLLVQRWGSRRSRPAETGVLHTVLAVAAAGTVTGALVLAVSSAHDDALRQAPGILQLEVVARGVVAVFLSDLLVLALLAVLLGGRLPLVGRAVRPEPAPVGDRTHQVAVLLGATVLGSAVVHGAVIPEHVVAWPLAGEFFWLLVMAETVTGVLVLGRRSARGPLVAAAWLSFATVLLWVVSRTRGLPLGPGSGEPEPVGVADLAATSLEVAALALAVALLWQPEWLAGPAWSAHGRALGLAAVAAGVALGVAGSTLPVVSTYAPAAHSSGAHAEHGS